MDVSYKCRLARTLELCGALIFKIHSKVQSHDSVRRNKETVNTSSSREIQYVHTKYCNCVTPDWGEEETTFCNSFLHLGQQHQTISPMGLRIKNHCAGKGQQ
jgi:hypothetical protein